MAALVIASFVFAISCVGLGRVILRFIKFDEPLFEITLIFFAGQVLFSFLWIVDCYFFTKQFNTLLLLPILIYGFVNGFFYLKFLDFTRIKNNKLNVVLFSILTLILSFYLVNSFIRPYEWDEIAYHFPVIREISEGKINFPLLQSSPYINFFSPFSIFFGSLPYSSESVASILYSISFNNLSAAHVLYLINFVFLLLLTNTFLIKIFKTDTTTNLLIDILISLSHGISVIVSTGLIDVNLLIYQFLVMYMAILTSKNYKYIYLFIFFASYALGQKYTSIFIIIPSTIYLILLYLKNKKIRLGIGNVVVFFVKTVSIFCISGGIWYIKNEFLYKNPVYPLYLGHIGMSDSQYRLLMDNLVYGLKIGTDFKSFFNLIKINYINETGLILTALIFILFVFFKRVKMSKENAFLILSAIFIYLTNFYFGSQLSRFILIVPFIFYILSAQVFVKHKYIGLFIVFVALVGIRLNPLQWSSWNARFVNEKLFIRGRYSALEKNNMGCLLDVVSKLKQGKSTALNLWDPYAASFYADENIFINIPNDNNLRRVVQQNMKYVYINNQYKTSFLANTYLHRDIDISGRIKFETIQTKNSKPVFEEDNCQLYLLDTHKIL